MAQAIITWTSSSLVAVATWFLANKKTDYAATFILLAIWVLLLYQAYP